MNFKNLHTQDHPLLICNVWDATSAKVAEQMNFQAIGTSSAAIAKSLGYEDGENISFSELKYVVERITASTNLPVSVDIESGYSRQPFEIVNHIKELAELGVVGINIEDSIVGQKRELLAAESFAETLLTVKSQLQNEKINIFMNVRTDTVLLRHPDAINETERRAKLYENAGADGLFVPCIENEKDIKTIVESSSLPINVLSMPNLPNFIKLKELGVKRISMGNFLFDNMYRNLEQTLSCVLADQSFNMVF